MWLRLFQELFNEGANWSLLNLERKSSYPEMCLLEAAIKYPGQKPNPREEHLLAEILLFLFFFLFEDPWPHPAPSPAFSSLQRPF